MPQVSGHLQLQLLPKGEHLQCCEAACSPELCREHGGLPLAPD